MIDHRSARYKRGASHYWSETREGIACHWCGMRAHWMGARDTCAVGVKASATRAAPEPVARPDVHCESMLEGERGMV